MTEAQRFERETKAAYAEENWALCKMIYDNYGIPTVHRDHRHGERDLIRPWMIESDLRRNNCRTIIKKDYWAGPR